MCILESAKRKMNSSLMYSLADRICFEIDGKLFITKETSLFANYFNIDFAPTFPVYDLISTVMLLKPFRFFGPGESSTLGKTFSMVVAFQNEFGKYQPLRVAFQPIFMVISSQHSDSVRRKLFCFPVSFRRNFFSSSV